jgi:hypothetical protein
MQVINYFYSIGMESHAGSKQLLVDFAKGLKAMPPTKLDFADFRPENKVLPENITCGEGEEPVPYDSKYSKWSKRFYYQTKRVNDCYNLVEAQEKVQGWRYEFVARVRPDITLFDMVRYL